MNTSRPFTRLSTALLFATALYAWPVSADVLQQSLDRSEDNNRREQTLQRKIDRLDDETQRMLEEYHALGRELDSLSTYNNQLERLVDSQQEEKALLGKQIEDIELTQREIVPLMLRMIDSLDRFVLRDTPFLRQERTQRVTLLRDLMDRSDISVAEKYRRVLEAYQIELDYSRTLEAYRGELELDGQTHTVDMLRLGRIGWYYQSLDGRKAAYWNDVSRQWVPMKAAQRLAVRRALRVANQQVAPQLLTLPVATTSGHDQQ
jgi:hypothetical protein